MRERTCCFSGHRPGKLPWRENEADPRCAALKNELCRVLEEVRGRGYTHFICGMAQGSDLYFAEAVLALREKHPEVSLEAAVPFPGQADGWSAGQKERYQRLLQSCDIETMVQGFYTPDCMHRRNRYMVERSSLLLAVYDGSRGGTGYTILQALRKGLELIQIDPSALPSASRLPCVPRQS